MSNIPYLKVYCCCACKERLCNKNRNRNIRKVTDKTIEKTRAFYQNDLISLNDYIFSRCPH